MRILSNDLEINKVYLADDSFMFRVIKKIDKENVHADEWTITTLNEKKVLYITHAIISRKMTWDSRSSYYNSTEVKFQDLYEYTINNIFEKDIKELVERSDKYVE
jgi:hypothetical protein